MKIYFACSIAGGRDHAHVYPDILEHIKNAGAQVISELFAHKILKPDVGMNMEPSFVWRRDLDWIDKADGIIAEVTQPSLGVGYEIALAYHRNKPVLALYQPKTDRRLSPMISGSPNVQIFEYDDIRQLKSPIDSFIKSL